MNLCRSRSVTALLESFVLCFALLHQITVLARHRLCLKPLLADFASTGTRVDGAESDDALELVRTSASASTIFFIDTTPFLEVDRKTILCSRSSDKERPGLPSSLVGAKESAGSYHHLVQRDG